VKIATVVSHTKQITYAAYNFLIYTFIFVSSNLF